MSARRCAETLLVAATPPTARAPSPHLPHHRHALLMRHVNAAGRRAHQPQVDVHPPRRPAEPSKPNRQPAAALTAIHIPPLLVATGSSAVAMHHFGTHQRLHSRRQARMMSPLSTQASPRSRCTMRGLQACSCRSRHPSPAPAAANRTSHAHSCHMLRLFHPTFGQRSRALHRSRCGLMVCHSHPPLFTTVVDAMAAAASEAESGR